jgi:hypothetical protein
MNDPRNRPPADLAPYLASAQSIPPVAPAAKALLLSRILAGVGAPPDPSSDGGNGGGGSGGAGALPALRPSPKPTLSPGPWSRALAVSSAPHLAGALLIFAAGGVVGALVDRTMRAPEVRTVYVAIAASAPAPGGDSAGAAERAAQDNEPGFASDPTLPREAVVPSANSAVQPAPPAAQSIVAASASASPAPAASASAGNKDTDLTAERSLLERARSALARGNVNGAIEALGRHAAEHPRGRLSEERDAIWIQALAAAGRTGEARQRLARYRASYPRSFSLPALEAALGDP